MHIDFAPPSNGIYNNVGSSRQLANYMEHEDLERMEKGIYTDGFFNLTDDNIYKSKVIKDIDTNIGQLLKTDAKFYAIHVSPSKKELQAMGNTEHEQAESMKRYIREVFIPEYAKNFNKDRRVWLEGSSMFHVRKQHGNTFKVYIDKAFIEVKGTRFLVDKKEAGNNEITLFNGCVEFNVEATGKQIVMKPMEKIFYNSVNAEIGIRKIENIEWQDGKFKFDAMPLNRLISIINQMYHANIVYEGKDETSPFSGTIRQEEALDDIILKICFLMNLKEERVGNTIIIRN